MPEFTRLPPLSLYIHIPWCVRKCPYCDFNSHEGIERVSQHAYIDSLLTDLEQELEKVWGRRLVSVFIGGGTPSLFDPASIDRLLSGVRARMQCLADMEVTLEANPGTFEQARFDEFRQAGINRLSIGIQSFDDDKLGTLGRIHGGREAIRAMETAHRAGFDNVNLDLMFGLPHQTPDQGLADLQTAIDLEPTHISWYQLTIEPNTLFYSQRPPIPEDDDIWALQQQGQAMLAEQDYGQYEISAYARPGLQCRHNINYWEFGDYLGIGAGAHGKLSSAYDQRITRNWKIRQPQAYMDAGIKLSGDNTLHDADISFEFMLNSLRLKSGFTRDLFEQHTGLVFETVEHLCRQAVDRGLMVCQDDTYMASEQGYLFLNDLINMFQPAED